MKIVIATPPGVLDNGKHVMLFPSRCDWVGDARPGSSYYPYELAYLSSLLKERTTHDVTMLDGALTHTPMAEYIEQIKALQPDILITECGHLTYSTMTKVLKAVKRTQSIPLGILTGPFGTAFPQQAAEDGWTPIIGEYERKILSAINDQQDIDPVDVDDLPFPEDRDVDRSAYYEEACIDRGVIQMYASRGCSLSCPFCIAPLYYGGHGNSGKSYRGRNPASVCDEIEYLALKYRTFTGAFFNEEAHNTDRKWMASLAQAIIDRGLNAYHYDAMCGAWGWSEDLIKLLSRAGYRQLRIGIETLDEQTGKNIKKRVLPAKLIQLLQWCKEYGIQVHGTTVIGLPGATFESDLTTLELLLTLKAEGLWHSLQHSPATPNPGTPFYQQAKERGWLVTDDLSQYHWGNVVVNYPEYPREKIEEMRKLFYLTRGKVTRNGDLLFVS